MRRKKKLFVSSNGLKKTESVCFGNLFFFTIYFSSHGRPTTLILYRILWRKKKPHEYSWFRVNQWSKKSWNLAFLNISHRLFRKKWVGGKNFGCLAGLVETNNYLRPNDIPNMDRQCFYMYDFTLIAQVLIFFIISICL